METVMAKSDDKKKQAEVKALYDKVNNASRRKDYALVIEACREIIALDARAKALNIHAFMFWKDMGEAQVKLQEYAAALECFEKARVGVIEHRATKKLKFPEDWLNELAAIEKLIVKTEKLHEKSF
jgi:tetratricopeptide (TPR) repeat protein